MPFRSNADLPAAVRGALPAEAQTIWRRAFDGVIGDNPNPPQSLESQAAATAWAAVRRAGFRKGDDGRWRKMADEAQTVEIQGAEIFEAGTHRGEEWTAAHLDEMVRNFEALKGRVKPFVKLGHDDGQGLLQKDGYPAGGWITALRRAGNKLVADIAQVPKRLAELIRLGSYKRVSSEIYPDFRDGDKPLGRVLRAVAFLGADMPQVKTLDDLRALFGGEEPERAPYGEDEKTVTLEFADDRGGEKTGSSGAGDAAGGRQGGNQTHTERTDDDMTAEEKAAYEARVKELQDRIATYTESEKKQQGDLDALRAELAAEKAAKRQAEVKAFIDEQKREGRVLPKHEAALAALMGQLDDEKVVTYTEGKGEVERKPSELLREIVSTMPKLIELKEVSEANGDGKQADAGDDPMKAFDERIHDLMDKRKIDYSAAAKLVYAEDPQLAKAYEAAVATK